MKTVRTVLLAVATLALFAGLLGSAAASSTSTTGYVAYGVDFNAHGTAHSVVVNESITGSTVPTLTLQVLSGAGNFSYSRTLNSSLESFPYLPSVTNQTFSYSNNSSRVSVGLKQNGSVSVPFHGSTYKLTSFTFTVQMVSTNNTRTIDGSILTFPSGLVYSVKADTNGTSAFQATLLSTSLSLTAASASGTTQAASVGIGAGAAASALALGLGVRGKLRSHKGAAKKAGSEDAPPAGGEAKPDHWVD